MGFCGGGDDGPDFFLVRLNDGDAFEDSAEVGVSVSVKRTRAVRARLTVVGPKLVEGQVEVIAGR